MLDRRQAGCESNGSYILTNFIVVVLLCKIKANTCCWHGPLSWGRPVCDLFVVKVFEYWVW